MTVSFTRDGQEIAEAYDWEAHEADGLTQKGRIERLEKTTQKQGEVINELRGELAD